MQAGHEEREQHIVQQADHIEQQAGYDGADDQLHDTVGSPIALIELWNRR